MQKLGTYGISEKGEPLATAFIDPCVHPQTYRRISKGEGVGTSCHQQG